MEISVLSYSLIGVVGTLAGSSRGYDDGVGELAKFHFPSGIVLNPDDMCLYVCDSRNHKIRKVTLLGMYFILTFIFITWLILFLFLICTGEVSTLFLCNIEEPYDIAYDAKLKLFYVSCSSTLAVQRITSEGWYLFYIVLIS